MENAIDNRWSFDHPEHDVGSIILKKTYFDNNKGFILHLDFMAVSNNRGINEIHVSQRS